MKKITQHHISIARSFQRNIFFSNPMVRGVRPFIKKIYEMLSDESISDLVSWNEIGDGFIIHDPKEFQKILPRFFKHNKLGSFVRQLHSYDFKKIVLKDRAPLQFQNKLFLRGQDALLRHITRKTSQKESAALEEERKRNLIDEVEYIKKLSSDNENMARAILIMKQQQLRNDREIIEVRKELTDVRSFLRNYFQLPRPPKPQHIVSKPDELTTPLDIINYINKPLVQLPPPPPPTPTPPIQQATPQEFGLGEFPHLPTFDFERFGIPFDPQ